MDDGLPDPDIGLAETFGALARRLAVSGDLDGTLDAIASTAVETIEACESCGISIVAHGKVTSRLSTNEVPRIVDGIQSETQEGPCVDAIKEHEVFVTGALPEEGRWPAFSQRAFHETGTMSVLALRLHVDDHSIGALNLYSSRRDAFDEHDIAVGAVFAAHAAVAMSHASEVQSLQRAVSSRDVIGRAKGVLMATQGIGDAEAFAVLRRASQRLNVKLRDVAETVASAERPPTPLS